jgi:formamidopyrimidine-DNA glycosylase
MPELPEVETICRGLAGHLVGRRLLDVTVRRHDLRLPIPRDFAQRLAGRLVRAVSRRAKYLLMYLDDETVVVGHLGMSGRLYVQVQSSTPVPTGPAGAHDHVVFNLSARELDGGLRVIYNDPRRFGLLVLGAASALTEHPLLSDLGPEPLDARFTGAVLAAKLAGRRGPIKAALLDQSIVAGLGNIYVSEALFRASVSPERIAGSLTPRETSQLVRSIRSVLEDALAAGGSTLRDYVQADGEAGSFQNLFRVYDRQGQRCSRRGCRGVIKRVVQAGRATYFCPLCQR